ncbi:MAG TPA: hypothetical protein VJ716_04615 [Gaiellaceae bacterium]|nr:hypothetical protein [Gaiellaceae bacterium]
MGFAFGAMWMTVGLGSAILCLLLAGLGYGAVFVAARAQTEGISRRRWSHTPETEALPLEGLQFDYEEFDEPGDDATSALAAEAEADYGWPLAAPETAHTETAGSRT